MSDKKIIELTPFRTNLTRALARRAERLLAASDPAEEVANLAPLEAYYIVREIGLDQALPLLLLLQPEQLEACIDLDCWQRHDFAPDAFAAWLAAYAQAGPETLARTFFTLDYVVQLLFLARTVTVYDPDSDLVPPEDEEQESNRAMTPDGFYLLELRDEMSLPVHPFAVLDALYQYDPEATHRLLREIGADPASQIEEEALRFRNGRMQDIGFVPPDEAVVLFSRPATAASPDRAREIPAGEPPVRLPSLYAAPLDTSTLLEQALTLITDPAEFTRLEEGIVWVINSAIIAYGEKTQDTKQITAIAERVRDTVSLGLESLLAQAEPAAPPEGAEAAAKACALLAEWSMTDLFRHGFAAPLELKREVAAALRQPRFSAWYNLTDASQTDTPADRLERAFVGALLGRHPLQGGFDLSAAEKVKGFAALAEIDVARVRLQRLLSRLRDED